MREPKSHDKQNGQTCGKRDKVDGVCAHGTSFLDLRDQVGGTDVKEVAGCERNEKTDINCGRDTVYDQPADEEGQSGEKVVKEPPILFAIHRGAARRSLQAPAGLHGLLLPAMR